MKRKGAGVGAVAMALIRVFFRKSSVRLPTIIVPEAVEEYYLCVECELLHRPNSTRIKFEKEKVGSGASNLNPPPNFHQIVGHMALCSVALGEL